MTTEVFGECNCNLGEEFAVGGPLVTMCHHTPKDTIEKGLADLAAIIEDLGLEDLTEDFYDLTIRQLVERDARTRFGDQVAEALNEVENSIVQSALLRGLALTILGLHCFHCLNAQGKAEQQFPGGTYNPATAAPE